MGIHAQLALAQTWTALQTFDTSQFAAVTAATSFGISAANGSAVTLARSDHTHGTPTTPVTSAIAGNGVNVSGATGAVTFSANFAGTGSANTVARSDHSHGQAGHTIKNSDTVLTNRSGLNFLAPLIATDDSAGDETEISLFTYNQTPANVSLTGGGGQGVDTNPARGDHIHNLTLNDGTLGAAITFGTSATTGLAGSSSYGALADHRHAFPAMWDATVPAALGTAAAGSATVNARRDHVHPTTNLALLDAANVFSNTTGQRVVRLGIGTAPNSLNGITDTSVIPANGTGYYATHDVTDGSTSAYGILNYIYDKGAGNSTIMAATFHAERATGATGTLSTLTTLNLSATNGAGTTTTATVLAVTTPLNLATGITTAYGIRVSNGGGGTTRYGVRIEDMGTGSASNLSLSIAGANTWSDIAGRLNVATLVIGGTQVSGFDATVPTSDPFGTASTPAAAGSATAPARRDHVHGFPAMWDTTAPTTYTFGTSSTSAATGSATVNARRDHVHGFPAMWDTTVPAALGTAATGSATVNARRDHVHPTTGLGVLSSANTWTNTNEFTRIGVGITPFSAAAINSSFTNTGSGTSYGQYIEVLDSGTSAVDTYGLFARARKTASATGTTSGGLYAIYADVTNQHTSQTVSAAAAIWAFMPASSGGVISNAYGVAISNSSTSGVTTRYGVYVADFGSGSANNYSIAVLGANTWSLLGGVAQLRETTAPATPPSGYGSIYIKSADSLLYFKNDNGTEIQLGSTSFGTPGLTFGTANSAGSASTAMRTDATIAIFDTTNPAALGTAATGSAAFAARRDHVHPTTNVALLDAANVFSHATGQQMIALGLGTTPDSTRKLNIAYTSTITSGANYAIFNYMNHTGAAGSGEVYGSWDRMYINSTGNQTGIFAGAKVEVEKITNFTSSDVRGLEIQVANAGTSAASIITNAYGVIVNTPHRLSSTALITNSYGMYIDKKTSNGVTNEYGLYIESYANSGASGTSRALYIEGTAARSTIQGKLEVNGADVTNDHMYWMTVGV